MAPDCGDGYPVARSAWGKLLKKQILVACGAVPALVIFLIAWQYPARLAGFLTLPANDTASRLVFVSRWLVIPGLTLLAGIILAAQQRFWSAAIDGTRQPLAHGLEINLRYNMN